MKTKAAGPEVKPLDASGQRFAFMVDGVTRFVGSLEECQRRHAIYRANDGASLFDRRVFADAMLKRALR